jgi:gliding motility-associated-like protein
MKTKYYFLLLPLLLLFSVQANAQTVTIVLQYQGAQALGCCNVCGSDYICFGGSCGCCFPNGNQTFADPIPPGNIITDVSITYFSADCGATTVPSNINSQFIGNAPVSGGNCNCGSCWQHNTMANFPCGLPNYNYGGNNTLFPTPNGLICADRVEITFTYAPSSILALPNPGPITGPTQACSGTTGQYTIPPITGASSYTWTVPSGTVINSGQGTNTINVTYGTTTGQICVQAVSACTTSTTTCITVAITPTPQPTVSANPTSVCAGGPTTLTATGGVTYTWSPANSLSATTGSTVTANPTTTTTYTVIATNGACSASATVTITITGSANATAGPNALICGGGSAAIFGGGGTSYSWLPATGLSCTNCVNPVASPTVTTTYTVTVTNSQNCTGTATVTITVSNPNPNATATSNPICAGQNTFLNSQGGGTYSWSPSTSLSNSTIANPIANPTTTTTYTVTVTDINGCTNTDTLTISVSPPIPVTATAAPTSICSGGSTQLTSTGGVSYNWQPSSSLSNNLIANPIASPTVTTTYTVIATDANGCQGSITITVVVNNANVTAQANNNAICLGDNTPLNTGGNGVSFSWSPGGSLSSSTVSNPTATPTATTTYTVVATDANGCTASATVTVTVNPLPNATATATNPSICQGSNTTLNAGGGTNYVWVPANSLSNPTSGNPLATPSTTTTYTVTVTDANGCSATATVTLTVNPPYALSSAVTTPDTCGSNNGTATVGAPQGGTAPYTYMWNNGQTTTTATGLLPGNYTVTVTDANGCTSTQVITVNQVIGANANASPNPPTGQSPLDVNFVNTSTGATNWFWDFGDGSPTSTAQNPNHTYGAAGTYTVMLIVWNNNQACADTIYMTVIVEDQVWIIMPNVFTPNGDKDNELLICTMNGIKTAEILIFNRWGNIIKKWDPFTGPWDGKGTNGQIVAEGTYYYTFTAITKKEEPYTRLGWIQVMK